MKKDEILKAIVAATTRSKPSPQINYPKAAGDGSAVASLYSIIRCDI